MGSILENDFVSGDQNVKLESFIGGAIPFAFPDFGPVAVMTREIQLVGANIFTLDIYHKRNGPYLYPRVHQWPHLEATSPR